MKPLHYALATTLALSFAVSAPTAAQWLHRHDPTIPRTADGKPDLTAAAPRTADGKVDFSGLWEAVDGRFLSNIANRGGIDVPFTSWGKALFDQRQANLGRDRPAGQCLPHSIPSAMLIPGYPWKVVQTPGTFIILYENFTDFRQIFTDGRGYPEDRQPNWFGYSLGRWEGDEFVSETVGYNDLAWLDDGGHPRSEQMRTTERFRRPDFGTLEVEFTFDDPVAYTAPWSVTVPFRLLPDTEIIENYCENERDLVHIFGSEGSEP